MADVIVSRRQMLGSAPENRTYHRPSCPSLKTRSGRADDTVIAQSVGVEAGYKACERCKP